MIVRTITCSNSDNYGARLQALALATCLREAGHDAQVLDYRPAYLRARRSVWPARLSLREYASALRHYRLFRDGVRRHAMFEAFSQRHMPLTARTYNNITELRAHVTEADALIAGSDQIWNPTMLNGSDASFYLDFGPESAKRISYAASFGVAELSEDDMHALRKRLQRFDAVSVREPSGAAIVEKASGKPAFVAVDPVFLQGRDYWDRLARPADEKPGYVLVYDFLDSRNVRTAALTAARALGCRVAGVGPRRLRYAHSNHLMASPEQFVGLIRGARCVVSNSFHATAFAMIFERDFIVADREDGLNERMHALLARYGLERRIAGRCADVAAEPIDYSAVRPLLEADIQASRRFLTQALDT